MVLSHTPGTQEFARAVEGVEHLGACMSMLWFRHCSNMYDLSALCAHSIPEGVVPEQLPMAYVST
jgi:hypothetical protein